MVEQRHALHRALSASQCERQLGARPRPCAVTVRSAAPSACGGESEGRASGGAVAVVGSGRWTRRWPSPRTAAVAPSTRAAEDGRGSASWLHCYFPSPSCAQGRARRQRLALAEIERLRRASPPRRRRRGAASRLSSFATRGRRRLARLLVVRTSDRTQITRLVLRAAVPFTVVQLDEERAARRPRPCRLSWRRARRSAGRCRTGRTATRRVLRAARLRRMLSFVQARVLAIHQRVPVACSTPFAHRDEAVRLERVRCASHVVRAAPGRRATCHLTRSRARCEAMRWFELADQSFREEPEDLVAVPSIGARVECEEARILSAAKWRSDPMQLQNIARPSLTRRLAVLVQSLRLWHTTHFRAWRSGTRVRPGLRFGRTRPVRGRAPPSPARIGRFGQGGGGHGDQRARTRPIDSGACSIPPVGEQHRHGRRRWRQAEDREEVHGALDARSRQILLSRPLARRPGFSSCASAPPCRTACGVRRALAEPPSSRAARRRDQGEVLSGDPAASRCSCGTRDRGAVSVADSPRLRGRAAVPVILALIGRHDRRRSAAGLELHIRFCPEFRLVHSTTPAG